MLWEPMRIPRSDRFDIWDLRALPCRGASFAAIGRLGVNRLPCASRAVTSRWLNDQAALNVPVWREGLVNARRTTLLQAGADATRSGGATGAQALTSRWRGSAHGHARSRPRPKS